jgi:hypothetical protein
MLKLQHSLFASHLTWINMPDLDEMSLEVRVKNTLST